MTESINFIENYQLEGELLPILTYPNPILKQVASDVTEFNQELEKTVMNMIYTMYKAPGIGLAAPQVGISKRFFVMDIGYDREEITLADGSTDFELTNLKPMVIVNPKFINKDGETTYEEGCLSVPGIYETVVRAETVRVEYQNLSGENCAVDAEGLLSICLQHENDHLDGVVFIERLSQLKQTFLKKKFLKQQKKNKL